MRIVLVGASALTVATARALLDRKHDVVIIDKDQARLEELEQELDCGLMHGEGSRPSVLKEAGPENTDALLCLGEDDQNNIIASLVGLELGFPRVVTKIEDPEYQPICRHLGLSAIIVPDLEVGRSIADMVEGEEKTSLSARLSGDLRFFTFIAGKDQAVRCEELDLPDYARVMAVTSDERSVLGQPDTQINEGDEVVLITDAKHAPALRKRFANNKENQKSEPDES